MIRFLKIPPSGEAWNMDISAKVLYGGYVAIS